MIIFALLLFCFIARCYSAASPETGAWSARNADYSQYLEVDLGVIKNITALATQGRQDSEEYVTAYTLSTAQDGILFSQVKGPDGSIWVSGLVRRVWVGESGAIVSSR